MIDEMRSNPYWNKYDWIPRHITNIHEIVYGSLHEQEIVIIVVLNDKLSIANYINIPIIIPHDMSYYETHCIIGLSVGDKELIINYLANIIN